MTLETIDTAINAATVVVCFFCSNLLLLRRRDPGVYMPLALLFLFQGISVVLVIFIFGTGELDMSAPLTKIGILFGALEVASPFLFWLYVQALTSEGDIQKLPRLRWHVIPIVLATLCFWSLLLLPSDFADADIQDDDPRLLGILFISLAIQTGDILLKGMIGTYIYLTIRRLISYRQRLKDVFASTENRELTWIWLITISAGLLLLVSIVFAVAIALNIVSEENLSKEATIIESLVQFILFWIALPRSEPVALGPCKACERHIPLCVPNFEHAP